MRCGIGTWRGVVAVALVAVLTAPPAGAASLRDALVTTYLTSPRLEAGRSELRQVDETVPQALSGYRPSLFLNGDLTGERSTVRQGEVFEQNRAGKSVNLSLRQNLYAGGGTQAQVSRAENQVQAQRSRLYGLEQQVLLDAVDAYTAAYRDQAVLDLALNNEERLKRQLEATRDRFDVGEVARTDVAQAEARLSRARADVEQAKADLASSRAAYQRVVGEEPTKLEEPKVLAELPKTEDETRAFAAQNPDIVAATFDLYAARDNVDVAFSDLLPSLDLRGELEYADEPTAQIEWGRTGLLGLTLSIPLYQGGGEYSRVRQNRQVVRQRRDDLETAHRSVQELVTSSWERLLAATAAIEAFRAEVRANQIALEGVQQEALVGARTVLDVLDAEQELFTSQVNLVRASREEVLASYQLKLAVGQLTVEGLSLPVQAYNPVAYYDANRTRLFGLAD
jgi:TolC family type I secretion outer membrane protein